MKLSSGSVRKLVRRPHWGFESQGYIENVWCGSVSQPHSPAQVRWHIIVLRSQNGCSSSRLGIFVS